MSRVRVATFSLLALGYAAIGFVVGRQILHGILGIQPAALLPMPGPVLQVLGFGLVLGIVLVGTQASVRFLDLHKM